MQAKIDLRQRYDLSEFPPHVAQLIEKCGGLSRAEQYAGLSNGMLGSLRNGKKTYTDELAGRVRNALASEKPVPQIPSKEKTMTEMPKLSIPEACPPILAELIRFKGSKSQAWKALGTSEGTFYKAINSGAEVPPVWATRAKAAMGQPVIAAAPAAPQGPEFVPWDGKSKGVIKTKKHGDHPSRAIKHAPQPIVDLVDKHDGVIIRAARAIGISGNTLIDWAEGKRDFTLERQRQVFAAFHGIPTTPEAASDYDTYKLDLAIVMLKGWQNFDRVNEIAEVLGGLLAWKKHTKDGWLLIYSMGVEAAMKFKRLAGRDASEIACP